MIGALAALPQLFLVAFGALAGLIAGSFIGALVARWPQGRSVARGRSACDACGTGLTWRELIPLVSFLAQRGRCRNCGAPIPASHVAAEAAATIVGASAFAVAPPVAFALAGVVFGWTLIALALLDLSHLWLPDRLTLPLGAAGVAAALAGLGPAPRDSLFGAAAGFGLLWLIGAGYRASRGRIGLGGGDPKLLGAVGAWVGWALIPPVLLIASVTGLAIVAVRAGRGAPLAATDKLPFGTLMALAAWPVWLFAAGTWG